MSEPNPKSSSPGDSGLSAAVLDAAALHLARRDRGASAAEEAAFAAWLSADPRHRAAVARLSAAWAALDALAPAGSGPAAPVSAEPSVVPFPGARRRILPWLAIAAGLALLFGLVVRERLPAPPEPVRYATSVGTSATHRLADGSSLMLNTDSSVEVAFGPGERRVRLNAGEVFFEVAPDAARPFVVEIESVRVRVVGTVFNVRRRADRVELVVAEGRVRVASGVDADAVEPARQATLGAADRSTLVFAAPDAEIRVERLDRAALDRVLAWREGRLLFAATPLSEALSEFSRHHRVRVEIVDPDLAGMSIGGAYASADLAGFLALLEAGFGVRVERIAPDHVRLHRIRPDGA